MRELPSPKSPPFALRRNGTTVESGEHNTSFEFVPLRIHWFTKMATGGDELVWDENTDRVSQLAVGGDVEDVLVRVRLLGVGSRGRAFSHEVVLVNIALRSSVSFEAADGHGAVVSRSQKGSLWSLVVGRSRTGGERNSGDSTKNARQTQISSRTLRNIAIPND